MSFYRMLVNEIKNIIKNCEEIQETNESDYTKEQAKISAYKEIKELFEFKGF